MKMRFTLFIERIEVNFQKQHFLVGLIIIIICIALFSRIILASQVQSPGYGDATFYFNVAENLVDGRGSQIDWIWNYLYKPNFVTHYAYDYWMPLTAIIISVPMQILGKSLFAALLPSILIGLMLSIVTYYVGRLYSDSKFVSLCSSGLALFLPALFQFSLVTDCVIYYVFFAMLSLLFMIKGNEHPNFFLLASVFAGVAYLTRQDALLLIPTLLLSMLPALKRRDVNLLTFVAVLGVFVVTLSPWMITNYKMLGQPFSPSTIKTIFFTRYSDFFSYSKEFTMQTFLEGGLREIILQRLKVAFYYIQQLANILGGFGSFLNIFALWGISQLIIAKDNQIKLRLLSSPPFFFLSFLFAFYTLFTTFPGLGGGFERGMMAIIPFLIVIAVDTIHRVLLSKTFALISLLLITSISFYQSIQQTSSFIDHWTNQSREYAKLKEIISVDVKRPETDIIVMADYPWLVYQSAGYKTIQIPIDKEAICAVVQKYRVNYLLLPLLQETVQDNYGNFGCKFLPLMDITNLGSRLYSVEINK